MFAQLLWWAPNVLEGLLLIQAMRGKFFRKYPVFYGYLSYVFFGSNLRLLIYLLKPGFYTNFYWHTEFLSVALGYGVIWEIFRQALRQYPGAARMARNVLLVIFVLIMFKVIFNALTGPVWSPAKTTADLERNLRTVQAILVFVIVGLLIYYAIPVGRNLKGIIVGYGLFIGASILSLTLISFLGNRFQPWWQYLPAVSYSATLVIWCLTLWSYRPNPQAESEIGVERDYELVAARTTNLLTHMRALLARATRP